MGGDMSDVSLAKLADEFEIRNLVARLAHLADLAPNLDEYLTLFTEDGIWEYSEASRAQVATPREGLRVVGRAAIAADRGRLRAEKFQGRGTTTYHVNTTLAVRVHDDGTAESESYWIFVDGKGDTPKVSKIGHYHDTYRRTPEGWKLAHRVVTPSAM
jgi:hypothetical protein